MRVIRDATDEEALRKTMFHIHRYREPWTPAAECEALTNLYEELVSKYGDPDDPRLLREFIDRTGYYTRTAQDRLRFLRWPLDLKDRVYRGDVKYWYVEEIESKIVEPARRNFPEYVNEGTVDDIRRKLFEKALRKAVGPAVAVRDAGIIAQTPVGREDKDKAEAILRDLVEDATVSFEEAQQRYLAAFPDLELPPRMGPVALVNAIRRLADELREYDEEYVVSGVGRSRVDVTSFVQMLDELSDVLQDLRARVLRAQENE